MKSQIAAIVSLIWAVCGAAIAQDREQKRDAYAKTVREGVRSPEEDKRFAVADDLRFFNHPGTPQEPWTFTDEIRILLKDDVLRVRTQALIALSSCASFIPRDEAAELAKELRVIVERNDPEVDLLNPAPPVENKLSIEESSTIFLALEALYTENTIMSAKDADWFENYDFVPAIKKLAEQKLESDERLQWIFFMMFGELRGTNNRVTFLPRLRKMALSGSPELFADTCRVLERLQGFDPVTWGKWIRQLHRNEARLLEMERSVRAKRKKLEAANTPIDDEQIIDLGNFLAFLGLARNEFARLGLDYARQNGADESTAAEDSKSDGETKTKPVAKEQQ